MRFRHHEVGLDLARVPHDGFINGVVPVRVGPHFQLGVAVAQARGATLEAIQVRLAQILLEPVERSSLLHVRRGGHRHRNRVKQHELGAEGLGEAGGLVSGRRGSRARILDAYQDAANGLHESAGLSPGFVSSPIFLRSFLSSRSDTLPSSERAKALTKALRRTLTTVSRMPASGFSIFPLNGMRAATCPESWSSRTSAAKSTMPSQSRLNGFSSGSPLR